MREILFRGKRVDNGEWVLGSLLVQSGERISKDEKAPDEYRILGRRGENYLVNSETVGQYTGLTTNGKKIFENDIVEYDETKGTFYQIIWIQSGWGSREIDTNLCELFPPIHTDNPTYFDNAKIVGNVHDNPELLEVGRCPNIRS